MKRVFRTRHFSRWMRKTELTDDALCAAVVEMSQGLIDADLGGGVVKKRVGLAGRGKWGGARTLVATNKEIAGSLSMGLLKMTVPISRTMNWMRWGASRGSCWF